MITKEAIEAGIKAADHFYLYEATDSDTAFGQAVEAGIRAALPFLPIAGEGKVKALSGPRINVCWTQDNSPNPRNVVLISEEDFNRANAALSSPGKDGGQEVEAVPDRGETCPHCKGEGCQPGDPEGAPLEACDYCNGSGKKISTQPISTALVERLMKALEPFCKHYEPWMERWDDQEASSTFSRHTFGDLREALAAINEARAALSASTSREGNDAQD